jgi:branched-chain amino acid transport system substrate-binding protein
MTALGSCLRLASIAVLAGSVFLAAHSRGVANGSPLVVKIGVLDDLTGPYSLTSGMGTVEAVRLAVEDYGGKALGKPVEVVVATDQNKPDLAVGVAGEWLDRDKVTAIIGVPVRRPLWPWARLCRTLTVSPCSPPQRRWI